MKVNLWVFAYGDVTKPTHQAVMREVHAFAGNEWQVVPIGEDALISRSRSVAMTKFLRARRSLPEVAFFIDRDMEFEPGAIKATCERAVQEDAIVGGLYSKRAFGKGFAFTPLDPNATVTIGADELVPARHLGTGFIACPRAVVERIVERLIVVDHEDENGAYVEERNLARESGRPELAVRECVGDPAGPYLDLFSLVTTRRSRADAQAGLYPSEGWVGLGEDQSFSERATFAGERLYVWTLPRIGHWGPHRYEPEHAIPPSRSDE